MPSGADQSTHDIELNGNLFYPPIIIGEYLKAYPFFSEYESSVIKYAVQIEIYHSQHSLADIYANAITNGFSTLLLFAQNNSDLINGTEGLILLYKELVYLRSNIRLINSVNTEINEDKLKLMELWQSSANNVLKDLHNLSGVKTEKFNEVHVGLI